MLNGRYNEDDKIQKGIYPFYNLHAISQNLRHATRTPLTKKNESTEKKTAGGENRGAKLMTKGEIFKILKLK